MPTENLTTKTGNQINQKMKRLPPVQPEEEY